LLLAYGQQFIDEEEVFPLAELGEHFIGCPTFVSWDKDEVSGDWATIAVGYGWIGDGGCFDMKVVECNADSDCGIGEICDKSGNWDTWSCIQQEAPIQIWTPMDIGQLSGTIDVNFDIAWSGGVAPFSIEIETGDGGGLYQEGITSRSYIETYTYPDYGTYHGAVSVLDSLGNSDGESFSITIESPVQIINYNWIKTTTPLEIEFSVSWIDGVSPFMVCVYPEGYGGYQSCTGSITTNSFSEAYTYSSSGTYNYIIEVYSNQGSGEMDSVTGTITVETDCPTFQQLITYANEWVSNQHTFQELINYANQWATC
jgi:hypothetical protein